jgi:hypothetical protein
MGGAAKCFFAYIGIFEMFKVILENNQLFLFYVEFIQRIRCYFVSW